MENLTVDSKTQQLDCDIKHALLTRDTVVVFTQYTDTMTFLRDQLAQKYSPIACYSGRVGEIWNPDTQVWEGGVEVATEGDVPAGPRHRDPYWNRLHERGLEPVDLRPTHQR